MRTTCLIFIAVFACALQNCNNAQSNITAEIADTIPLRYSFMRDSAITIDSLEIVFYIPVNASLELTSRRPLKSNDSIVFSCAAAFTLLDNGKIDGLFIENGTKVVSHVNRSLGGGIIISGRNSNAANRIFGTEMGKLLDSTLVDSMVANSCSFFQQIQMVRDGQPLVFRKDVSKFQRRAICVTNGKTMIVETLWPCTLQKFADVLKKSGIFNALYVDMGSWDEGWKRDDKGAIKTIGIMRNSTSRQSNWILFRQKAH